MQNPHLNPPFVGVKSGEFYRKIESGFMGKEQNMILMVGPIDRLTCEISYLLATRGVSIRVIALENPALELVERLKANGATFAVGSLLDPLFLADACMGINGVICAPGTGSMDHQTRVSFSVETVASLQKLIDAAMDADVPRFVYIVPAEQDLSRADREEEQAIEHWLRESSMPCSILHRKAALFSDAGSFSEADDRVSIEAFARLAARALADPDQQNNGTER